MWTGRSATNANAHSSDRDQDRARRTPIVDGTRGSASRLRSTNRIPSGNSSALSAIVTAAEHVQRAAAAAARRGRDRERRDDDRPDRVQPQLLPDVLRAQHPELEQQHEHGGDRRRRAEHASGAGSPNAGLEQEDHDREHRQQEARDGELGDLVQAQLREAATRSRRPRAPIAERLREQQPDRRAARRSRRPLRASPHGTTQHVREDRVEHQLLDRRAPAQERQTRARSARRRAPSSICPNSSVPPWFSTGIRPVSFSTSMKNAAIDQQMAGSHDLDGRERSVAPSTYGRSVCVVSATTKITKITVGSLSAPNDRSRLEPSCAYGLPLSIAASETAKPAPARGSARRRGCPPMYPSGSPKRRQHRDQQRHRRVRREAHIRRRAEQRTRPAPAAPSPCAAA